MVYMLKATVHRSCLLEKVASGTTLLRLTQTPHFSGPSCVVSRLTLEGEAGAKLVTRLIQLLRIERATDTEGQAAVHLRVVGEGGNAEVVDLGLPKLSEWFHATVRVLLTLAKEAGSILYLAASSRPTAP